MVSAPAIEVPGNQRFRGMYNKYKIETAKTRQSRAIVD